MFSVTDKAIAYWAILNQYRRKILANKNGGDCSDSGVKRQWEALGLEWDAQQPKSLVEAKSASPDTSEFLSSTPDYIARLDTQDPSSQFLRFVPVE